jgi:hypothetical protein
MHGERVTEIKDPGPLKNISKVVGAGTAMMMTGICAFFILYTQNKSMAWAAYLEGFFFVLCLSLFGIFFVAVNHLTKAVWIVPVRRIPEAFASFLTVAVILFIPILCAHEYLYPWAQPDHAHLYGSKASYLSSEFWMVRVVFYMLVWTLFARHFIKLSVDQDFHKQKLVMTLKSAVFLIIFGFSLTLFAFDVLMSLRPHWFSTMYGVYCFAGSTQAGLAMMVLFILYLRKEGHLKGILKDRHLFDAGTWLLAWCTFMCYIGFSQFMLIWYANLPEETVFFRDHLFGEWKILYIAIFFIKWAIPFFVLMPKPHRVNPKVLVPMCVFLILAEWLDIYWMVAPETIRAFAPEFGQGNAFGGHFFLSFLVGLGFLGAFLIVVSKFLRKNSVVAYGEPNLLSSVNGDYL